MQNETKFKIKVRKKLDAIPDLWVVKVQQTTIRGTPDFLICYQGRFVAWELKTTTGKLSSLQQYNLARIADAGGIARVVTPDSLEENLKELLCLKDS